jgi:hypothetical protein
LSIAQAPLVRVYDSRVTLVGRWWNGKWGRLVRRDIWLTRQTVWHVRARQGDGETGRELHWSYTSEAEARAMVERLMCAEHPEDWRDLTEITRRSPTSRNDR